jgi:hypothetical protein
MAEESGYIAVDLQVLAAIRELFWVDLVSKEMQPVLRLVLQVVRVDQASGNVIINAQLVRDLDPPAEHPRPPEAI